MISDVDDDDNGYITVEEFIPLMTQVIHEDKYLEDEILELFVHFGKERSFLSSESLASKLLIASNGALTAGRTYLVLSRELFRYKISAYSDNNLNNLYNFSLLFR